MYLQPNIMQRIESKGLNNNERKEVVKDVQPPFNFLIFSISLMVRSCHFVKQTNDLESKLFNGNIAKELQNQALATRHQYSLDKYELDILINNSANDYWWSSYCKHTDYAMVRNAIAKMFAHIAYDNE